MTTEAEYKTWLADTTSVRCVLIEAVGYNGSSEETFYFSNRGYITSPTDTPANTKYVPCINGSVSISERLNLDGTPSVSFGDIDIENINGDRDAFIGYIWSGRDINIYHGDMFWNRADFYKVFTGTIDSIDSGGKGQLKLSIRNKIDQLNVPIMETKLGGLTDNSEKLLPVCFGEVANVSPLLEDPATHKYKVHNVAIEDVIEVRDFGYPVSVTKDIANGRFTLLNAPYGTITASIQGNKNTVYYTDVAGLIKHIVKTYGTFTDADIDLANFTAYSVANAQQVSCYYSSSVNILTVINYLANSLGTKVFSNRLGLLKLIKIELPPVGTPIDITNTDMIIDSFSMSQILEIKPAIQLGACKNHTPQPDLQTGISELSKALFADEWIEIKSENQPLATLHNMDIVEDQKDTALISKSEAQTESDRLLALWSSERSIYSFECYSKLMYIEIGQAVTIYHSDYGLDAGVDGLVISCDIDWSTSRIRIEVLV